VGGRWLTAAPSLTADADVQLPTAAAAALMLHRRGLLIISALPPPRPDSAHRKRIAPAVGRAPANNHI